MSATDRTSTTRLLALAALLLAAGVFAVRAADLFSRPAPAPIGDRADQELTYLIEPLIGADKVRVSLSGRQARTVLVLLDGEATANMTAARAQIESILEAAIGFDAETDTLTLKQFPFAPGVTAALRPIEIAELTGLGLLCGVLLMGLINRSGPPLGARSPLPVVAAPREPVQARLAAPEPEPVLPSDLHTASTLAETKPNETTRLVRDWMSYAED
ncbi:MAG: hypothetical protein AAFY82_03475 [Pseudomonadota bacterium]